MYGNAKRPLAFGIDFDDTITAAPELFKKLIELIRKEGHYVAIVTARNEGDYDDLLKEFSEYVDTVCFTSAKAKQDAIEDIDIWIDDFPLCVTHQFEGGKFVPGKEAGTWT